MVTFDTKKLSTGANAASFFVRQILIEMSSGRPPRRHTDSEFVHARTARLPLNCVGVAQLPSGRDSFKLTITRTVTVTVNDRDSAML